MTSIDFQSVLPKFSDLKSFIGFWDLFEPFVYKHPDMDPIDKIILLINSCEDARLKAILPKRAEQLDEAVKYLKERFFHSPSYNMHLQKLGRAMRPLNDTCTVTELRERYEDIVIMTKLSKLSIPGSIVPPRTSELFRTLPPRIQRKVAKMNLAKHGSGMIWSSDEEIQGHLHTILRMEEYLATEQHVIPQTTSGTIRSLTTHVNVGEGGSVHHTSACLFCSSTNHTSLTCEVITSKTVRYQIAKTNTACLKCYSVTHSAKNCHMIPENCRYCGRGHNSSDCLSKTRHYHYHTKSICFRTHGTVFDHKENDTRLNTGTRNRWTRRNPVGRMDHMDKTCRMQMKNPMKNPNRAIVPLSCHQTNHYPIAKDSANQNASNKKPHID